MTDHVVDGGGDHVVVPEQDILNDAPLLEEDTNLMQGMEEYFYELLIDMDLLSKIRRSQPTQIQAAQIVLSREILRVWDLIYSQRFLQTNFDENRVPVEEGA
ncbi:hypothetical protein OESDEN_13545 [Oesophagostomum dentatum]|uniref:Uncharacterized protein n=1 Tax=Oesophagostomum dentatum TaxID=61180 RepID=A0A0B1SS53_OESDE|nr:hypothetical protein OESDEN_13545 [Oesophagostomum dentatum]